MASKREPPPTTLKVLDSPSGEQSYKSLVMAAHLLYPFRRTHGVLLDMLVPYRNQVSPNFNINTNN
jgi:hypothetical protein